MFLLLREVVVKGADDKFYDYIGDENMLEGEKVIDVIVIGLEYL